MDDYYGLLGVDTDATVDDIRGAYRERKGDIDTTSAAGRASAAQLNKAWNVLSDPYQRGRYDEQRSVAVEEGTLDDDDTDIVVTTNGTGRKTSTSTTTGTDRKARAQAAREARVAAQRTPTITLPEGVHWPRQKQRVIAMAIDLALLLVVFVGSQLLMVSVEKSSHRAAYDARQELNNHTIPDAKKQTSSDNTALSNAKKENGNQVDITKLTNAVTADKDHETALTKKVDALDKTLAPTEQAFMIGFLVIALLYLIVPSALTGRTLGKRITHIKVIRENGAKLGFSAAIVRYGVIVIVAYVLSLFVGPLAPVVVLFGVTMWMRNPNMQGLHDRMAHTLVVSDEKG
jgi:uncharacterized RDD family membrane protein YckC